MKKKHYYLHDSIIIQVMVFFFFQFPDGARVASIPSQILPLLTYSFKELLKL
jgi:hypothetical protein